MMRPDELERRLQERLDALGPAPCPEVKSVWSLGNASAVRPQKDPRPIQPPREPNWRKVTLVLVAIVILVALAIAFGEIIR